MKIAIFNTQEQATEYFDRDYSELISPERIVDADALALTLEHYTPKQRDDGKWTYPALDSADYTGIEIVNIEVPQPTQTVQEYTPLEETGLTEPTEPTEE